MVKLSEISTRAPEGLNRDKVEKGMKEMYKRIGELQEMMLAGEQHSLLVVFQGMDASGKDGLTKRVFRYCSPVGIRAQGFGKPTEDEFAHDFLWRIHKHTPAKGMIQVFNRSHYEDILIQRVHGWIDEEHVEVRINAINAFESLLQKDNNTTILKFYLHLSEERQLEKLQERIDLPRKNYKHNSGDWEQRKHWDKYMECYEGAINRCNIAPWYIVPADQRWYRNFYVTQTVLNTLENLNMEYPLLDKDNLGEGVGIKKKDKGKDE